MDKNQRKKKSHLKWSWIIIISFFILGIYDFRFGLLGFGCVGAPIYHALRGRGKIHCSHYCPRGSFLGKFLPLLSLNNTLPKWMNTKKFRNILLVIMILVFSFSLYHSGLDIKRIGFSIFRFMGISFILGILMGVIFKPRSWCQVCPMGHATGLIREAQKQKKSDTTV